MSSRAAAGVVQFGGVSVSSAIIQKTAASFPFDSRAILSAFCRNNPILTSACSQACRPMEPSLIDGLFGATLPGALATSDIMRSWRPARDAALRRTSGSNGTTM